MTTTVLLDPQVEDVMEIDVGEQDTVSFSYGEHPKTQGLEPIGKSNEAHDRGLIMHNALAFTATGMPLGLLSQSIWAPTARASRKLPSPHFRTG